MEHFYDQSYICSRAQALEDKVSVIVCLLSVIRVSSNEEPSYHDPSCDFLLATRVQEFTFDACSIYISRVISHVFLYFKLSVMTFIPSSAST